jgi:hypothetical protein
VEELERRQILTNTTGPAVQKKGGRGESFGPELRRHGCVGEHGSDCFVEGAQHALGAAILRRSVGARHAQGNAMAVEEGAGGVIVELAAIVGLERENREVEVILD